MSLSRNSFDVIVIGNGAIGLACAFELIERQPDLSIAIVGPDSRPRGASVAAGAMLGCHAEITAHGLSNSLGREKFSWHRRAKTLWPNWLERIIRGGSRVSVVEGTFVLCNAISGSLEDENFAAIQHELGVDEIPHEHVDPRDVPGLRPTMDARAFRVVHIPDENAINALEYLGALERNLAEISSIALINELAISLELKTNGSISGVKLRDGRELKGNQVLLAAGVGCQTLIEQCPPLRDRFPRIFAGVGTSLVAAQPREHISNVLRTPNRSFSCGLHLVPRGENVYIGATNTIRDELEMLPRLVDVQFLLDSVIPQIAEPIHASLMLSMATGSRPVSSDCFPLLGATPVPGLFIATGTFRDGIQLSPLLAQHIADVMLGGENSFRNPFHPERRPIWNLTIDDAVSLCTSHYLGVFYENGCHLPKVGWEDFLSEMLQKEVREIYEPFGTENLPPIDFVHLLRERKKRGVSGTL